MNEERERIRCRNCELVQWMNNQIAADAAPSCPSQS